MYWSTTQCNSKTYYRMFQLSATVPNLCPQPKSSLITHLINDRLLDALLTVIQTSPQFINISHGPAPIALPRFCNLRTKVWNVTKSQVGRYNWSPASRDKAARYFWDRWPYFAGKLSWDITTTQVNWASHPSGVAKSSTSFGWGKGGKVTSAGWQVTLCDLIWHVISRSGVVISITNCYIRFTLRYVTYDCAFTVRWPAILLKLRLVPRLWLYQEYGIHGW